MLLGALALGLQAAQGARLLYAPVADNGQAVLIRTANAAGDLFVISNSVNSSGRGIVTATKLDASGRVLAAANLDGGGLAPDQPAAAAVDSAGNLIVVGSSSASRSAFVIKLGSQLANTLLARSLGGQSGYTMGFGVALDAGGNIYVSGSTSSVDFPVTDGAFQTRPPKGDTFGTPAYAFLTKLSPDGSRILASTYYGADAANCSGGSGCIGVFAGTGASAIAADPSGLIWIAGSTTARDLPTTPGAYAADCACGKWVTSGFVAAFDNDLSKLRAATFLPDRAIYARFSLSCLAITPEGDPLIAGSGDSGLPTTSGVVQPLPPEGQAVSGYVAKLDRSLGSLLLGTYFGTHEYGAAVKGIELDSNGSFWITGAADPATLPIPQGPTFGPTYVARLAADASRVIALQTAPAGAAGQALDLSPDGSPVALGATGSVLTLPVQANAPVLLGIANAAGSIVSGKVAPNEVISLYGAGIGPSTALGAEVADGFLTSSLGGYSVLFDDTPAPLLYAGPNQFNAVVPSKVWGHDAVEVSIVSPGGVSTGPRMGVVASAPEVFGGVLNQDGTQNSPSAPGIPSSIVSIWFTGGGTLNGYVQDGQIATGPIDLSLPVSVLASRVSAYSAERLSLEVLYAGSAPGMVLGVNQVNFRLPQYFPLTLDGPLTFDLQVGEATGTFTVYVTN